MLSDLSSVILREIIITINEYESIINLKLLNKRIFKFINDDVVVKRYYLKLKYNFTIDDKELFNYIKFLEDKCYSKFVKRRTFNKESCFYWSIR